MKLIETVFKTSRLRIRLIILILGLIQTACQSSKSMIELKVYSFDGKKADMSHVLTEPVKADAIYSPTIAIPGINMTWKATGRLAMKWFVTDRIFETILSTDSASLEVPTSAPGFGFYNLSDLAITVGDSYSVKIIFEKLNSKNKSFDQIYFNSNAKEYVVKIESKNFRFANTNKHNDIFKVSDQGEFAINPFYSIKEKQRTNPFIPKKTKAEKMVRFPSFALPASLSSVNEQPSELKISLLESIPGHNVIALEITTPTAKMAWEIFDNKLVTFRRIVEGSTSNDITVPIIQSYHFSEDETLQSYTSTFYVNESLWSQNIRPETQALGKQIMAEFKMLLGKIDSQLLK